MKRIFCLILSVLLSCSLCACSVPDEENIIGSWEGTIDYAKLFNESLLEINPGMAEYWHVENFDLVMIYSFREDGTFKAEADRDKLSASMDQLRIDLGVGYLRYMEDKGLLENGVNSAALAAIMEEMISDDYFYAILIETYILGNYKVEDGKLYASSDTSVEVPTDSYEIIEFKNNNTLIIKEFVGGEDGGIGATYHPLTLTRK